MRESCHCDDGWIPDRLPVYAGAGRWALRCPRCGHLLMPMRQPEHEPRAPRAAIRRPALVPA